MGSPLGLPLSPGLLSLPSPPFAVPSLLGPLIKLDKASLVDLSGVGSGFFGGSFLGSIFFGVSFCSFFISSFLITGASSLSCVTTSSLISDLGWVTGSGALCLGAD